MNAASWIQLLFTVISAVSATYVIIKGRHETRKIDAEAAAQITESAVKLLPPWEKRVEDLETVVTSLSAENLLLKDGMRKLEEENAELRKENTSLRETVNEMRDRLKELTDPSRRRKA